MNISHFKNIFISIIFILFSTEVVALESDDNIRDKIIQISTSSYSGSCPCPYFSDRAGRSCGRRSAYNRPGGSSPLCYRNDVTDEMVRAYKVNRNK